MIGAVEQRDAADEGRLEAYGNIIVGTVIVNCGEVVRPSQLIASVRRTYSVMIERFWQLECLLVFFVTWSACSAHERGISGGVSGGIGDDVCAVPLVLDITVHDSHGAAVPGVQVEYRADNLGVPWWRKAEGVTDAEGHLLAPGCYQGSRDYSAHPPHGDTDIPVTLSRCGFQSQTVSSIVSAAALANDRTGRVQAQILWMGVPITVRATMTPQ